MTSQAYGRAHRDKIYVRQLVGEINAETETGRNNQIYINVPKTGTKVNIEHRERKMRDMDHRNVNYKRVRRKWEIGILTGKN